MPSCSRATTDELRARRGIHTGRLVRPASFQAGNLPSPCDAVSWCGTGLRIDARPAKRLRAMVALPRLGHLLTAQACPHTHVVRRNEAHVRVARALRSHRASPEKFAHFGAFGVVQRRKRRSRLQFFSGRDKALKCRIGDHMHRCMHSLQVVRMRQALHLKRIKQGVSAARVSRTQSRCVFLATIAPPCRRRGHRRSRPGTREKVAPGC